MKKGKIAKSKKGFKSAIRDFLKPTIANLIIIVILVIIFFCAVVGEIPLLSKEVVIRGGFYVKISPVISPFIRAGFQTVGAPTPKGLLPRTPWRIRFSLTLVYYYLVSVVLVNLYRLIKKRMIKKRREWK